MAAAVLIAGCVHSHTHHSAVPLGDGKVAVGFRGGLWYARADEGTPPEDDITRTRSVFFYGSAFGDYGLTSFLEVGAELGIAGVEGHAKLAHGKRGAIAVAIVPSVHAGFGDRGGDVSGLVTFGPVTAVGFWGGQESDGIQGDGYAVYGGGLGFRRGPIRGGLEIQRWDDPAGVTLIVLQGGYWWSDDGTTR